MKILYCYAHPNEKSFNALLKTVALDAFEKNKVDVLVSDLYATSFSAAASWSDFTSDVSNETQYFLAQQSAFQQQALSEDIMQEIEKIKSADHLIFQFPLWWFSVPAILKGWLDRVLIKGFTYDAGKIFEHGLLQGKTASLVVTTQSPEAAYQMDGVHHATIDVFLKHIHHTLHFVGIKTLDPFVVFNAFQLSAERVSEVVAAYEAYLKKCGVLV